MLIWGSPLQPLCHSSFPPSRWLPLSIDAKWPLLNLWHISVGSNFVIHLVAQLPLFIGEEVELQRRGISWSKLPGHFVSQLKEERFYLLDLCLELISVHQNLIIFGKTRSVGCGVSWWQIQTSSLWLGSYMTVGTESLLVSFVKWRCVGHSVWYTGVLSESVFITINANPFTLKHEKPVRLGGGEHSIL